MFRHKKRLIISFLVLVLVSLVTLIFLPVHFSKDFFNGESLVITYTGGVEEDSGPYKTFEFDSDSPEYHQLNQIFDQYTCHNCFHTWRSKINFDGGEMFIFTVGGKRIIISEIPEIIVGTKVYRVGYLGNSKIRELNKEIKEILEIE